MLNAEAVLQPPMKKTNFTFQQNQDLRSLAVFRILAGVYLMYDIVSRLEYGRFSLSWYTSTENSFLHPDDTPHRSPVHRIWFYRGGEALQLSLFAFTFLLSLSLAVGYKCNVITKTLLWLNVVAMQCRCMPPHDGSDTYFRNLLLWCIQLPVEKVWSIDAVRRTKIAQEERSTSNTIIENRTAVWGIRLQMVLMYLGTVMKRTFDRYGYSIFESKWLPPQLTAVYYALSGSLATRECWLGDFVRSNLHVSQFMTFTAMLMEGFAPILCLVMGDNAHIPAFLLFKLHFGLLILMNLPNWQIVGMISTTIWIPSWMWDRLHYKVALKFPQVVNLPRPSSPTSLEKKDMVVDNYDNTAKRRRRPYLSYFFFTYMIYDFAGNREWIRKIDSGDIGEFLRFSQYWVMFDGPPTTASQVMLTGTLDGQEHINVWEWIKTNGRIETVDMKSFQHEIWTNFTHVYPSSRIERSFSQWGSSGNTADRSKHFLNSLCHIFPFEKLTLRTQYLKIQPPGGRERYIRKRSDFVSEAVC